MELITNEHRKTITEDTTTGQRLFESLQKLEPSEDNEPVFSETLRVARDFKKQLEAKRTAITKPLREATKNVDALFKPAILVATQLETLAKGKLFELARHRADQEAARQKALEEALEAGQDEAASEIAQELIEAPTRTEAISMRRQTLLEISDPARIPRKFLVPDERAISAALAAGEDVPGCALVTREIPVYRGTR